MRMLIERYPSSESQTLGNIFILNELGGIEYECVSLELPWKNNERNISCIQKGIYTGVIHYSPNFGKCIWIQNVEGRSEILIHSANFNRELKGCISPGLDFRDIDNDNYLDVVYSRKALDNILKYVNDKIEIEII